MKTIHLYIGVLALLLSLVPLHAQNAPEARFGKLSKTYTPCMPTAVRNSACRKN